MPDGKLAPIQTEVYCSPSAYSLNTFSDFHLLPGALNITTGPAHVFPDQPIDIALGWCQRFLNCFFQLSESCTNIKPPRLRMHNRKSPQRPRLQFSMSCQQFYRHLFYNDALYVNYFWSAGDFFHRKKPLGKTGGSAELAVSSSIIHS